MLKGLQGLVVDEPVAVCEQGHVVGVVAGEDDAAAFVAELQQEVPHTLNAGGIESVEGFVKDQDLLISGSYSPTPVPVDASCHPDELDQPTSGHSPGRGVGREERSPVRNGQKLLFRRPAGQPILKCKEKPTHSKANNNEAPSRRRTQEAPR